MESVDRTNWDERQLEMYDMRLIPGDPISVYADGVLFDPIEDVWLIDITAPNCVAIHVYDLSLAEAQAYLDAYRADQIVITFRKKYYIDINNLPTPLKEKLETEKRTEVTYDLFVNNVIDKSTL
jgi:hypothetical protein